MRFSTQIKPISYLKQKLSNETRKNTVYIHIIADARRDLRALLMRRLPQPNKRACLLGFVPCGGIR